MCEYIWIGMKFIFMYAGTFLLKVLTSGVKNVRYQTLRGTVRKKMHKRRELSATSPTHLLSKSVCQCPSGVREPTFHSQFQHLVLTKQLQGIPWNLVQ
jgi:hypothetical protein